MTNVIQPPKATTVLIQYGQRYRKLSTGEIWEVHFVGAYGYIRLNNMVMQLNETTEKEIRTDYLLVREAIASDEQTSEEHQRLVREIDVIINGEEGAAEQASLCDLVGQIRQLKEQNDLWVPKSYEGEGSTP